MLFCATYSSKIGSKAIRWGLDQPASHFCVVFDQNEDLTQGLVFHSYMKGVTAVMLPDFLKENKIAGAVRFKENLSLESQESIYQTLVQNYQGKRYDYGALAFWLVAGLAHKLIRTPLPSRNLWSDKNHYLCTGIAERFKVDCGHIFQVPKWPDDFEMVTPWDLMYVLLSSPLIERVKVQQEYGEYT